MNWLPNAVFQVREIPSNFFLFSQVGRYCGWLNSKAVMLCSHLALQISVAYGEEHQGERLSEVAPQSSGPSQPSTTRVESHLYMDQLIDPSVTEDSFEQGYYEQLQQPRGRRTLSTELVHFQKDQDGFGRSHENGVRVRWSRETLNYGDLSLDSTLSSDQPASDRSDSKSMGGVFTLKQHGFALSENWNMDNAVGVIRSMSDSLVASSFRLNLPSTLLAGVTSQAVSKDQSLRFSAGNIGRVGTSQLSEFATTDGRLMSLGYSRRLGAWWYTGVQLVDLNGYDKLQL